MADLDVRSPEESAPPGSPPDERQARGRGRRWRWFIIVGAVLVAIVVYAYAFKTTDVDLEEIESETRQTQLFRIIRSLARPEIFTYETVDTSTDAQFMSPCPEGGFTPPELDTSGPYLVLDPVCVEPGGTLRVSGFNMGPNVPGQLRYVADSGVEVRLGGFRPDTEGSFVEEIDTRERPSEVPQTIRASTALSVGSLFRPTTVETGEVDPDTGKAITVLSPRFSQTSIDTWEKIIETVFLALIATTIGTIIAVPLSFFASRNLMKEISVTMTSLTLSILGGAVGVFVGLLLARATRTASEELAANNFVLVGALLALVAAMYIAVRWLIRGGEESGVPSRGERSVRIVVLLAITVGVVLSLFLTAAILSRFGAWLAPKLGALEFLALFLSSVGDILKLVVVAFATLITGGAFMVVGGRLGDLARVRLPDSRVKPLNLVLAALAGATIAVVLAQVVAWLYQITDPSKTLWIPAAVGAGLGLLGALALYRRNQVGVGLSTYYGARTLFNAIRAIEPLVMVIVFVVWVGIGPFAGALALSLHTAASLAKLYSEQVESISLGPLEAVKATGATRLQTIMYAVVPQIVPPYISFTMYRWDINVRMSTIIGFAGGGGIGFLLQQNINLLNYRAAAVQMLAIAIVVATMDYISSRLRERFV